MKPKTTPAHDAPLHHLGDLLRAAVDVRRNATGESDADVARRAGCHAPNLSRAFTSRGSGDVLAKVCAAYGWHVEIRDDVGVRIA